MAEPYDQLLLKMGIDLSGVRQAGQQIKQILDSVGIQLQQVEEQSKATLSTQANAFEQIRAAASAAASATKTDVAEQDKKVDALKGQTEELHKQTQTQTQQVNANKDVFEALKDELNARLAITKQNIDALAAEKEKTEEIRRQTLEYVRGAQLTAMHAAAAEGAGGGAGGGRGLLSRFGGALFGGGLIGSVATGVLAGQGIGFVIEKSVEGLARFIDKLKSMQVEASRMTLIQYQFEGLAKAAGIDAAGAIDKMRKATEGVVDKMTLMKTANAALKSPFGLSIDEIAKMEGAVVRLAEANGHTAVEAIEAFNRSITSGMPRQLLWVTGLSRAASQLDNVAASATRTERRILEFRKTFDLVTSQSEALGAMPQTLEQLMSRLSTSWRDLLMEFGRSFQLSAGTQTAISLLSKLADLITGSTSGVQTLGKRAGDAFQIIAVAVASAIPVAKQLWELFKSFVEVSIGILTLGRGLDGIVTSSTDAVDPVTRLSEGFININLQIELMLLHIRQFFDYLKEHKGLLTGIGIGILGYKGLGLLGSAATAFSAGLAGEAAGAGAAGAAGAGAVATGGVAGFVSAVSTFASSVVLFGGAVGLAAHALQRWLGEKLEATAPGSPEEKARLLTEHAPPWVTRPSIGPNGELLPGAEKLPEHYKPPIPPMPGRGTTGPQPKKLTEEEQLKENAKALRDEVVRMRAEADKALAAARPGIKPPPITEEQRLSEALKLLQAQQAYEAAQSKLMAESAKARLAEHQVEIQQRQEQDKNAYDMGLESLAKHLENQKKLEEESYKARAQTEVIQTVAQIQVIKQKIAEENAKYELEKKQPGQHLEDLAKLHNLAIGTLQTQLAGEEQNFSAKMSALRKAHESATFNLTEQGVKAELEARRRGYDLQLANEQDHNNRMLRLKLEALKAEQQETERGVRIGTYSPAEYVTRRLDEIRRVREAEDEAAKDAAANAKKRAVFEYVNAPKTPTAGVELLGKLAQADKVRIDTFAKNLQQAIISAEVEADRIIGIQIQSLQRKYQPQIQAIQGQLTGIQGQPGTQSQAEQLTAALTEKLAEQRDQLVGLANSMQPYTDQWYQVYENAVRVNDQWIKAEESLLRMRDLTQPIAAGFQAIGQGIAANFRSKFAQDLAQAVEAGAKSIQESTALGQRIRGRSDIVVDPAMQRLMDSASGLFTSVTSASDKVIIPFQNLVNVIQLVIDKFHQLAGVTGERGYSVGQEQWSGEETIANPLNMRYKMEDLISKKGLDKGFPATVASWTEKLGASIAAISNFTGAILNAHSAISGGAGGAIAGLGLGNAISQIPQIGAALGPWGAIGGAVIGGVVGVFTGAKNAAVTRHIHEFEQQYKEIMNQFAMNTNNLQNTIIQVTQLIAQIQQMQANSKKGGEQYSQLISQYVDQLQQLRAQQHQIIVNMNEMLAIANQPIAVQSYLQDLQGIFKTLQQNIGAAATVEDLANAYALLNAQLDTYVQNQKEQLLQNNTQAIQDALQLNDLLYQQWQMELQFNQQVQSILSQGVLVRTPTRAMTAGAQIYELQLSYDRQKQQIDEQIAAQTFRVQQESKIFELATTRIGLENQLLTAQNSQTLLDMQRITMLMAAIQAIQTNDFSLLPGLQDVFASVPRSTNPINTENVVQDGLSSAYQTRAMMGYATYKGQNVGL